MKTFSNAWKTQNESVFVIFRSLKFSAHDVNARFLLCVVSVGRF